MHANHFIERFGRQHYIGVAHLFAIEAVDYDQTFQAFVSSAPRIAVGERNRRRSAYDKKTAYGVGVVVKHGVRELPE